MNRKPSAILLAVFTISLFSFFQCEKENDFAGLTIEKWKIGEGTNVFERNYTESNAGVYEFRLTGNSLCQIYGVKAVITVNGTEVMNKTYDDAYVHSTDLVRINIPANATVHVKTERFNTGSLVLCVRGGEAFFELEKK